MHRASRLLLLLGGLIVFAGCGTSAAAPGATDGSIASDDGASDAGDESDLACNLFQIVTPVITQMQVATKAPAPAGGKVADGVYLLTAENRYPGASGAAPPMTGTTGAALSTGETMWQYTASENGGPFSTATATVDFSGTTVTQTFTCPDLTQTRIQDYTATATELRLYTTSPTWVDEAIFTMR